MVRHARRALLGGVEQAQAGVAGAGVRLFDLEAEPFVVEALHRVEILGVKIPRAHAQYLHGTLLAMVKAHPPDKIHTAAACLTRHPRCNKRFHSLEGRRRPGEGAGMKTPELSRRRFLQGTGALIVSFSLFPRGANVFAQTAAVSGDNDPQAPASWAPVAAARPGGVSN